MSKQTRNVRVNVTSNVASTMTKGTVAAGGLSTGLAGVGASANIATGGIRAMTAALISSGVGAVVVAVGALVMGIGSLIGKAREFDKSFSKLAAITGKTKDEISGLKSQAKDLGATTAFTATEVVGLQVELAKLGFTVKEISTGTPAILDLAASMEVDLASAAALAGSSVRAFGLETSDTARVVDVMALSTSSSALNFEGLREALKLVAPVSKATGVSIERTTALLGVLADRGLKGSIAGTGLAQTFVELNKKGLTLEEGMAKINASSNRLGTAMKLAGTRGGRALLTLTEGADDIERLEGTLLGAAGAAEAMANLLCEFKMAETVKLSSAWEGFMLSLEDGSGILSRLTRGFVQMTTSILSFFTVQTRVSDAMQDQATAFSVSASRLSEYEQKVNDTTYSEKERNMAGVERDRLFSKMQKEFPTLLGNLNIEKDGFQNVAKAVAQVNEELINKIILQKKDETIEDQMNEVAEKRGKILEGEAEQREIIARVQQKFGLDASMTGQETISWLKETDNLTSSWGFSTLENYGKIGAKLQILRKNESSDTQQLNILQEKRNQLAKDLGITLESNQKIIKDIDTTSTTVQESDSDKEKRIAAETKLEADRLAFLKKLGISEENFEDTTELLKIERRRERHLSELDQLKLNETEKREAAKRINDYYDGVIAADADKTKEENKVKYDAHIESLRGDEEVSAMQKIEDKREMDILALDSMIMTLEERQIALGLIETNYNTAKANEEERLKQQKIQGMYDIIDSAARLAGEESKIGKALLALKTVMQLKELIMKMVGSQKELAVKRVQAAQEVAIEGAGVGTAVAEGAAKTSKIGFPWNIPAIAGYALQAASLIKSFGSAKKKMTSMTGINTPDVSMPSAVGTQAPSFNVLGATSAGDNMIADVIGSTNNSPMRAYVVESDVASAQSLSRNANDIASID